MKRKEQYADEIIEMLERTKCGGWASNVNLNTKDRVIEVCQNVVDSWSGRKFKDHCITLPQALEQTRWIPVSERLPKDGQYVLFCDIDNDIMVGYHVKGRPDTHFTQDGTFEDMKNIRAWQPLPQPYKAESKGEE